MPHNTQKKCICLEDNKLTQALCPVHNTQQEKYDWQEEFDRIIYGIDKDEVSDNQGWWETSTGAEFGKRTKSEIKSFITSLLSSQKEEMVKMIEEKKIEADNERNWDKCEAFDSIIKELKK